MSSEERSCLVPRQEKFIAGDAASSLRARKNSSSSESINFDSPYSEGSSDSYYANWEEHIEKDGTLFYAEYSKVNYFFGSCDNAYSVLEKDFQRSSTRRSTNKIKQSRLFTTFMSRNDVQNQDEQQQNQDSLFKTNNDIQQQQHTTIGDVREIEVFINPENRFKFGRRATVTEAILGISTIPFVDDPNKIILAGHMMHSTIIHDKSIKMGDLFLSINDVEVTAQNVNELLEKFQEPTKIYLKFQKILTQEQILSENIMRRITNFESFVKESTVLLKNSQLKYQNQKQKVNNQSCFQNFDKIIFSLLIINEEISDSSDSSSLPLSTSNDVVFSYPNLENNVIYNIRGTFLTLSSILKSEFRTEPLSTTVNMQGIQYNICYMSFNKLLILYSISSNYSSNQETKLRMLELFQYIKSYLTIEYDINEKFKTDLKHVCDITLIRLKNSFNIVEFETLLQGSRLLPLPKEAQLRIFDALGEMEAMDYRDWNDEPLNSHREFFIYGSALYYRSFLLANQLPAQQLHDVETFLRCKGIFDFIEYQNVRDLIIWTEIPIMSNSRHFLAISSRNQLLLAVILQVFDSERRITEDGILQQKIISPSLFYIEEFQETLDHLRHGGIGTLAKAWIISNKRPQIVNENNINNTFGASIIGSMKTNLESAIKRSSSSVEDIQLCSSIGGSSAHSLSHIEDSNKKLSECDSDSDWDEFQDSHKSSSGFDVSEMTESLLKEVSDILPTKITSGNENVLLNYIHIDLGTGIIITPPDILISPLVNKFRKTCYVIHTVLQNTKKFRRLLSQETVKPNVHKSLVAIKEHGIVINDDRQPNKVSYWVIGRLFASPPRELYVCHRSDIPQNLVEIAFRLSFITAG